MSLGDELGAIGRRVTTFKLGVEEAGVRREEGRKGGESRKQGHFEGDDGQERGRERACRQNRRVKR